MQTNYNHEIINSSVNLKQFLLLPTDGGLSPDPDSRFWALTLARFSSLGALGGCRGVTGAAGVDGGASSGDGEPSPKTSS